MFPKRDYSSLIRRSQHLTTVSEGPEKINQVDNYDKSTESENLKEVNNTTEGTEPKEPTYLELGENREQDTLLPSIEEEDESENYNSAPKNNNLKEVVDELPLEQEPSLPTPTRFTMSRSNNEN
jgi:hypothetical protein